VLRHRRLARGRADRSARARHQTEGKGVKHQTVSPKNRRDDSMDINDRLDAEAWRDHWVHEHDPERIKKDITAALWELHERDPIQVVRR
jgi:hypothetical protein